MKAILNIFNELSHIHPLSAKWNIFYNQKKSCIIINRPGTQNQDKYLLQRITISFFLKIFRRPRRILNLCFRLSLLGITFTTASIPSRILFCGRHQVQPCNEGKNTDSVFQTHPLFPGTKPSSLHFYNADKPAGRHLYSEFQP